MYSSVYDLKSFYTGRHGRLVRRLVTGHIMDLWPDLHDMTLMGYGYAVPFMRPYINSCDRVFAVMPSNRGVHAWPSSNQDGMVCLSQEASLPLPSESVDRVLMVHGLEESQNPHEVLSEVWRVLKSNGRLLMVVPNRMGMWARVDWTPFGHGQPYTAKQISGYLQENLFVQERMDYALFMPPFRSFWILRAAYSMEGFGRFVFPGLAGLRLIEASKQVYAGGTLERATSRNKGYVGARRAVPTS